MTSWVGLACKSHRQNPPKKTATVARSDEYRILFVAFRLGHMLVV